MSVVNVSRDFLLFVISISDKDYWCQFPAADHFFPVCKKGSIGDWGCRDIVLKAERWYTWQVDLNTFSSGFRTHQLKPATVHSPHKLQLRWIELWVPCGQLCTFAPQFLFFEPQTLLVSMLLRSLYSRALQAAVQVLRPVADSNHNSKAFGYVNHVSREQVYSSENKRTCK